MEYDYGSLSYGSSLLYGTEEQDLFVEILVARIAARGILIWPHLLNRDCLV